MNTAFSKSSCNTPLAPLFLNRTTVMSPPTPWVKGKKRYPGRLHQSSVFILLIGVHLPPGSGESLVIDHDGQPGRGAQLAHPIIRKSMYSDR